MLNPFESSFVGGLPSPVSLEKPCVNLSQLELDYDDDVIIESEPPPKRIKSRQGTGGERPRNAIRNSLATPTRLPREETIYLHSDEEDLIPDTTGLRSLRSPAPLTPAPTDTRLPLDPGIIRAETVDRHSSRRYILKFDPTRPRPEYALKPRFGHLPGLYVGKKWHYRIGASWDGTHAPSVAGISGKVGFGVYSIALSGGYEDDIDEGYRKNLRTGPQAKDQDWNKCNRALRENVNNEKPVRVIRGSKGDPFWSPKEGFMYSGLYEVVACWIEKGKSGFDVIRFAFKRLPDQEPLVNGEGEVMPEPDYDCEDWKRWEWRLTQQRADEVMEIKKEETFAPDDAITAVSSHNLRRVFIKIEDD